MKNYLPRKRESGPRKQKHSMRREESVNKFLRRLKITKKLNKKSKNNLR